MEAMNIVKCLNIPSREIVQCFCIKQLYQMQGLAGNRVMKNDLAGKNTPYLVPTHSLLIKGKSVAFWVGFKTKNLEFLSNSRFCGWALKDLNLRPADYESVSFLCFQYFFAAFLSLPTLLPTLQKEKTCSSQNLQSRHFTKLHRSFDNHMYQHLYH